MKLDSRKDFETLMFRILDPLKPLYSDGGALLQVDRKSTRLNSSHP